MNVRFDIDKEKNVITGVISGPLDRLVLNNLLTQLKIITSNNHGYALLFDLTQTSLSACQMDMHRVIDIVSAIIEIKSQLSGKIAHVVPDIKARVVHAEDIGAVATIRGINYRVFTDIKEASDWLTS